MADDKIWSNDDVELLLPLWEENECLYNNTTLVSHKHSLVIALMTENLQTTGLEVSKQIRSMQSYFCQQQTKARRATPSGSSAAEKKHNQGVVQANAICDRTSKV